MGRKRPLSLTGRQLSSFALKTQAPSLAIREATFVFLLGTFGFLLGTQAPTCVSWYASAVSCSPRRSRVSLLQTLAPTHGSGSQAPSRKLCVGRVPKDRKCAWGVHQGYARTVRQNFNGPLASSSMGGARGPSNFAHCSYSRERSVELPAPPAPFQASSRFKAVANWDYPTFQLCFKFISGSSFCSTLGKSSFAVG